MDKNGYNPSVMQRDLTRCYLCGRTDDKLDRHEIFHADKKGVLRAKSKRMGLWVVLCHSSCHQLGPRSVHRCRKTDLLLKQEGEQRALDCFGWTTDDFIEEFGKNYL